MPRILNELHYSKKENFLSIAVLLISQRLATRKATLGHLIEVMHSSRVLNNLHYYYSVQIACQHFASRALGNWIFTVG